MSLLEDAQLRIWNELWEDEVADIPALNSLLADAPIGDINGLEGDQI